MNFNEKWNKAVEEKDSILCVGIDTALPGQRPENTIPKDTTRLEFALDLIEQTGKHAAAFKPNRQYLIGMSSDEMREITQEIHNRNAIAIIDHKAVDIGSTNDSAFYHAQQEGFDGITYCPFPGNVEEAGKQAHKRNLGLIILTLMSNPEFLSTKNAAFDFNGEMVPGYIYYAHMTALYGAAPVIGAPSEKNHVTEEQVQQIKNIIGDKTALVPGIGAQGGQEDYLIKTFGRPILNVGRDIIYHENPAKQAEMYQKRFNEARKIASSE